MDKVTLEAATRESYGWLHESYVKLKKGQNLPGYRGILLIRNIPPP